MTTVRFEPFIPGDDIYRTMGITSFENNQHLGWIYANKEQFYFGVQKPMISRTALGCLIDQDGVYHPEMSPVSHKTENILAAVGINKPETHIIERQIRNLESLDLGRQPALRSHARGLMSRLDMDRLDGIDINNVLSKNPGFYSQGHTEDVIISQTRTMESLDLGRQPALRSHARGLMSRLDMDRLDGIDISKVLSNNPAFYSQGHTQEEVAGLEKGETFLSNVEVGTQLVTQEGDTCTKTDSFLVGKRKISIKQRCKNFFKRLCCISLTPEV